MGVESIAVCVEAAGGIFVGLWETPAGCLVVVTDPLSRSTTVTPATGLSITSVATALAEVRQRFGAAA